MATRNDQQPEDPMSPVYLQKLMVGAIHMLFEDKITPEKVAAVAAAAQAFVALRRVNELETEIAMLRKQLALQRTSVSA